MGITEIITTIASVLVVLIGGYIKIRRQIRENKKTIIAPDNKPLRSRIVEWVQSSIHRGAGKSTEQSEG